MTGPKFEQFLAKLYTDPDALQRFLDAPEAFARAEQLEEEEIGAAIAIDREGLLLAAESFARKRAKHR